MVDVRLEGLSKRHGGSEILRDISLEIGDGEFVVLVGPSGCGKSTLLRLIAGLDQVSAGDIFMAGRRINDLPPAKRGIAMVFQSYALYPHMSARRNMAFGLRAAKLDRAQIERRVDEAARILQLEDLLERRPAALSGGQRQRVAIGRAIVREPDLFLFDEPLSNLDAGLRVDTRLEIARLHRLLKATILYVTHDQAEAMTLADRIVVMNDGRIEQTGTPTELYAGPENLFVAGFIGSPKMNFIAGAQAARLDAATLGVRPEHLKISLSKGSWSGTVQMVEHLGSDSFVHVECPGTGLLVARERGDRELAAGQSVHLAPESGRLLRFDDSGKRI